MKAPNPWEVLSLPPGSDVSSIRCAYKRLAMQHHPDRNGCEKTFKQVSEAYHRLLKKDSDGEDDENPVSPTSPSFPSPTAKHRDSRAKLRRHVLWVLPFLVAVLVLWNITTGGSDPPTVGQAAPVVTAATHVPTAMPSVVTQASSEVVILPCTHDLLWTVTEEMYSVDLPSLDACSSACKMTPKCVCFSWTAGVVATCMLFSSCASPVKPDDLGSTISGYAGCVSQGCAVDKISNRNHAEVSEDSHHCGKGGYVPVGGECRYTAGRTSCDSLVCREGGWATLEVVCNPMPEPQYCESSLKGCERVAHGETCIPSKEGHLCHPLTCTSDNKLVGDSCKEQGCAVSALQLPMGVVHDGCSGVVESNSVCTFLKLGHTCPAVTCVLGLWSTMSVDCSPDPCPTNALVRPSHTSSFTTELCNTGRIVPHGFQCEVAEPGATCIPASCDLGTWNPQAECEAVVFSSQRGRGRGRGL